MENNVVSLETAKKLKAAGFPQGKSAQVWLINNIGDEVWDLAPGEAKDVLMAHAVNLAAPTAQEIGDEFTTQDHVEITKFGDWIQTIWYHHDEDGINHVDRNIEVTRPTMAEALAALYIKLKEAGE